MISEVGSDRSSWVSWRRSLGRAHCELDFTIFLRLAVDVCFGRPVSLQVVCMKVHWTGFWKWIDASICVTSRVFYLDVMSRVWYIVTFKLQLIINPETRADSWTADDILFSVVHVPLNVVIISNHLDKYNKQQTISCTSMVSFVVVPVTDDLCAIIGYQLWTLALLLTNIFVDALCHDQKTRKRSRDLNRVPLFMDNIINTTTRHSPRS